MFKKIVERFSTSSSNSSLSEGESPKVSSRHQTKSNANSTNNLRRNSRSNPTQLNAQHLLSSSDGTNAFANLFLNDDNFDLYNSITSYDKNNSDGSSSSGDSSNRGPRRSHSIINTLPEHTVSGGHNQGSNYVELVFDLFDNQSRVPSASSSSSNVNRQLMRQSSSGMQNSASFSATTTAGHDSHYENEIYKYGSTYSSTGSDLNNIDYALENADMVHETNNILFRNRYHSDKALHMLNELRKTNTKLCDVVLVTNDIEISCHKAILIANSSYFLSMFSVGLMETSQTRVKLNEIDSHSLKLLVDFMYTGQVLITEGNVQPLLITSNILNLISVKDSCCQFIQSQIEISNCLGIREFADFHSCPILQKHAEAYIEEYFSEIIKSDEFLSLSETKVVELISNEHLALSSELIVFNAVTNWIDHDRANRIEHLPILMRHVRMPLMKNKDLKKIAENEIVKRSIECKSLIDEALFYQQNRHLPTTSIVVSEHALTRIKPRTPLGLPKVLYLFGGQAPKAIDKVDAYDFKTQQWKVCRKMSANRCRAGCVFHKDLIYLIGGFNGQNRERSVDIYNPNTDEWYSGPEMQYRRGTLGVALLNDKIYAVGGFDGQTGLMTVECLDTITKSWSIIAPLSIRRSSVSSIALNNYLYAIGGYCGVSRECLDSVERYDPFTDAWTPVAPMHFRRSGACVCIFDFKIYVVGGHDGPSVHKSAEVYNPITNKWELIAEMNSNRRNSAFVINNGLFYIIGGDDGHVNLSSVEIYNPQRNMWTLLPSFLHESRSYLCGVVVEKLT